MSGALHGPAWARGGEVDPEFGSHGVVTLLPDDDYIGYEIASLPGGRLLVAHSLAVSVDLFMYRADGALDPGFGRAGVVNIARDMTVSAIAAAPDGRILLTGTSTGGGGFSLLRLNADGTTDASFGANGKAIYPLADIADTFSSARTRKAFRISSWMRTGLRILPSERTGWRTSHCARRPSLR